MGRAAMSQQLELFELSTGARVLGVDEVGRGPLAGNVVAAAVCLPATHPLCLRDSKKLSGRQRAQLAQAIQQTALAWAIGEATPEEIDRLNILQATFLAMRRAIEQISGAYDVIWVDGNRCPPDLPRPCRAMVKGDDRVDAIQAASILAKVHRDAQMMALHEMYPDYGFDRHKGYPTPAHLAKLEQLGVIEGVYRFSFAPVRRLVQARG